MDFKIKPKCPYCGFAQEYAQEGRDTVGLLDSEIEELMSLVLAIRGKA